MLTEFGYQSAVFSARYIDAKGESRECFHLPRVQGSSSSTIGFQGVSEGRERALNTFSPPCLRPLAADEYRKEEGLNRIEGFDPRARTVVLVSESGLKLRMNPPPQHH